ncbi:MAG: hypothetical protein D6730_07225 [Bacteroidetes bacterium]|nr:MAG: hypothetical protein D6730_07225 [Bacteroidota bacterium]
MSQPRRSCATMYHLEQEQEMDPGRMERLERIEEFTEFVAKSNQRVGRSVITIPVVVHVVYHTEEENISDEQILSQIEVLNEDFGRFNADANQTPVQFMDVAADTRIRFQLATTDPYGEPTTGITRTYTDVPAFSAFQNEMKFQPQGGMDAWPTQDYLNIWVCNLSMGVLGYSQFPGGPAETDGVVICYKYFGRTGDITPPFNLGRTATHEIGHWLNLRHIWGDGPCGTDDLVEDTPEAEGPTHGCLRTNFSCGSPDMVSNFMDYTDDACMNLFTQGQANRMRALFLSGGERESLLYSPGLSQAAPPVVDYAPAVPGLLEVASVTEESAQLMWEEVPEAASYLLRLRALTGENWRERSFRRNRVKVSELQACTNYEFQVASMDTEGGLSDFSNPVVFRTMGCSADAPTGLVASAVYPTEAVLEWDPVEGVDFYKLQYRKAGTRDIISREVSGNRIRLTNLSQATWYQYRVRAIAPGYVTPYSKVANFYTYSPLARMRAKTPDYFRVQSGPYPDVLEVSFDLAEDQYVRIVLKNAWGETVVEEPAHRFYPGEPYQLETGGLAPGTYTLEIEDDQGFQHAKEVHIR